MHRGDSMNNPICSIQLVDRIGRATASRRLSGREVLQLLMDKPTIHLSPIPREIARLEITLLDRRNKQLVLPLSAREIHHRIDEIYPPYDAASMTMQLPPRRSSFGLSDLRPTTPSQDQSSTD